MRVAALEFLENAFLIRGRDADPGIGHGKDQFVAVAARLQPDRAAGRGEFDGVRDQIEQRLLQPPLVGLDRADIARAAQGQGQIPVAGTLPGQRHHRLQHRADIDRTGLERHVAGLDRRQVEDVVDQRHQAMRAVENAAAVFELPLGQRAEILVRQDLGEADDRVERGAQLVGDVGDELALEAAGGFQRVVPLAQDALDPRRVGDVEAGHQDIAVGQWHRRQLHDRAVAAVKRPAGRRLGGDVGDDVLAHRRPIAAIVVERTHPLDDIADMRLPLEIGFGQRPDLSVTRIMQLQPPIAAKQRNALIEVVERLALHLDQGVVRAFQSQPVGDVLVDEKQPAQRVRRHRDAERPVIGQVHQLVLRLDQGGEQPKLLPLEEPEIGEFRDAAALAQAFENLVERWMPGEPILLDAPQPGEGRVEEAQPLVGAIDRDRGMDVFEHLAVRVDVPDQFGFRALEVGAVDRKADRAAGPVGQLANLEQPARAADHDVPPLALDRAVRRRPRQCPRLLSPALRGELAGFGEHRLAQRIERAGIGVVAVDQPQAAVAPPDRQRDCVERLAQGGSRRGSRILALLGGALAGYVGQP